ncbi:MAG: rhomboid family intramembrane serine protease [Bacteroidia bacterium]
MSIGNEIKRWYTTGSIVSKLILVNAAIFIAFTIIDVIGKLTYTNLGFIQSWLYATSNFSDLLFKPWSIVTYMFLHGGFWHILFNMLFLSLFGRIFLTFLGTKKFLAIYLLGGIVGYLFYATSYNLFPYFSNQIGTPIVGASAAIMAIMAATVTLSPNYEIRLFLIPFNIKIIWIGLLFFLQDIFALKGSFNLGGSLAHIGGAVFGYIAILQLQKGKDILRWFEVIIDKIESIFKPSKLKVSYRSPKAKSKPMTDEEYNLNKKERQQKVDAILDKIKQSGYESLTKTEKDFLFNEGKKL